MDEMINLYVQWIDI